MRFDSARGSWESVVSVSTVRKWSAYVASTESQLYQGFAGGKALAGPGKVEESLT